MSDDSLYSKKKLFLSFKVPNPNTCNNMNESQKHSPK